MDLVKSQDYFNPMDVNGRCHIIGCGSVGSTVAELLVRGGVKDISLYDFDEVSSHNIANQMFFDRDIGNKKVDALYDMLCSINPEVKETVKLFGDGYSIGMRLGGYVFLCVDNIDLRREIVNSIRFNTQVKAVFDFRTRLEEGQHYAARWNQPKDIDNLLNSMDFSHDEAKASSPVTACNIEIGVAPTVRIICSLGVANFMNLIRKDELKRVIIADAFNFDIQAF